MHEIEIDVSQSIEENASSYYAKSKKSRKKLEGIAKAITLTTKKIEALEKQTPKEKKLIKKRQKKWFERFRWFFTSDNELVIAGKDAKSNEELVKKFMADSDVYFHADVVGAPHTVLKSDSNSASKKSMEEAACFAASFSKAWQSSLPFADVYSVLPKQVSKSAPSGESLGTGAFMIYGKRKWFKKTPLCLAIGVEKNNGGYRLISGPPSAVKKNSAFSKELVQGNMKKSDTAKNLLAFFEKKIGSGFISSDEIIQALPAGKFSSKND